MLRCFLSAIASARTAGTTGAVASSRTKYDKLLYSFLGRMCQLASPQSGASRVARVGRGAASLERRRRGRPLCRTEADGRRRQGAVWPLQRYRRDLTAPARSPAAAAAVWLRTGLFIGTGWRRWATLTAGEGREGASTGVRCVMFSVRSAVPAAGPRT